MAYIENERKVDAASTAARCALTIFAFLRRSWSSAACGLPKHTKTRKIDEHPCYSRDQHIRYPTATTSRRCCAPANAGAASRSGSSVPPAPSAAALNPRIVKISRAWSSDPSSRCQDRPAPNSARARSTTCRLSCDKRRWRAQHNRTLVAFRNGAGERWMLCQ